MLDAEALVAAIRAAFAENTYPGDAYLQGSFDGCEPEEEVGPFVGQRDWQALTPEFLDARYCAPGFFSEAAFRFYMPAFLVADVRRQLETADPVFHLTHGFSEASVEDRRGGRVFVRRWGKSVLINPRRYGAATTHDYARYRLSVFTREEAAAIVEYLRWRGAREGATPLDKQEINGALELFWLERARSAPTVADLAAHLREEREYVEAIEADRKRS
jgi:hypothetical protein